MAKGAYIGVTKAYKLLDYIESSGTQYINTEVIPNQNTRIVLDVQVSESQTAACWLFGSRQSSVAHFWVQMTAAGRFVTNYATVGDKTFSASVNPYSRNIIDKNSNVTTINGETITHTAGALNATVPMFLFVENYNGTATTFTKMKLYSCQIYDNGTLVRDYIPCEYGGEYGLYDKVGRKFYTNAGTGTFVAGPETGEVISDGVARKVKNGYIGIEGLARKIKKTYIGVPTEFPVYGEETPVTVTLTSENIADYFDVTNDTYGFTGDTSGKFSSSTTTAAAGITSTSTWTAKCDITNMSMSFYSGSNPATSRNFKFTIEVAGVTEESASKGGASGSLSSLSLKEGESIVLTACVGSTAAYVQNISFTANVKTQVGTETKSVAHLCYEYVPPYTYTRTSASKIAVIDGVSGNTISKTIYYADDFDFDAETGVFSLVSPSSMSLNYTKYTDANNLAGKYFIVGASSSSTMYFGSASGSASRESSNFTKYYVYFETGYEYVSTET